MHPSDRFDELLFWAPGRATGRPWGRTVLAVLVASLAALGGCGTGNKAASDGQPGSTSAGDTTPRATARPSDSGGDTPRDTTVTAPMQAVEVFSAAELGRVGDALARGTTTARTLVRHTDFWPIEARRSTSGVPEVHEQWIDVTWVQAGRAALLTGGRVSGSHQQSAGELRGGTIQGGTSRPIVTGDVFIIPAGTPHQFVLGPGDSIRYLTVKVRDGRQTER